MLRRLKFEEGWFTLFLVWTLVILTASAILEAEWMGGLELLPLIGTAAIFSGLALAKSHFSNRTAHLISLVYGLFLVAFLIGRSLPGELAWQERVQDLIQRQFTWLGRAVSERSSRDGLTFIIHTSAVFWVLGYTAAWYTFRQQRIWRVILPSGLVLLSVIYYYYGPKPLAIFLALYVLVALVYVARTHLVAQERIWRSAAVRYEGAIRFSFLRASFMVAILSLGVAWSLPTASASTAVNDALGATGVNNTWRKFQDDWTRLYSSLRSYGGGTSDPYRDTLSLGGPRTVGNELIMDIYVGERLPYVYWQGIVYDTYQGGTWSVAGGEKTLHFPDEGPLNVPFNAARMEVVQTVMNFLPNVSTIYGAPELVATDRQIYVLAQSDAAGKALVNGIQSRFIMKQGERYRVVSRLSIVDASSLRQAPTDYPDWVQETYLQMPDTLTPETLALAQELTAGYDNPFDKAIAVRDYLRANIAYNDQISAPPDGVEPIHYILFERKEAYCNYYASAMVMMLRSQGIPARIVAGYAQGEWDEDSHSYRVRSSNAHTWVEAYFPGYGWIQFEPTASLPAADRPETAGNPGDSFASPSFPQGIDQGLGDVPNEEGFERLSDLLGAEEEGLTGGLGAGTVSIWQVVGASAVMGLAIMTVVTANRLNHQVESNVEKSYGRLESWARWLGIWFRPVYTPYERANLLAAVIPEGKDALRNLVHQFVRQRFSPHREPEDGFNPLNEWRVLRPLLLRQTLYRQFQRWRTRKES
ncbi:MAG: DUF3488 and transglutaminase-like domain-containing protein [Chloroflexi bacterium]|nr:DUF3488 and transglutaminase-like domain-containing protein [Chloroflexota bacterium]MCI0580118.1 DUF3488 and transglutaminase-like domain-containing protein [Chloroflexota bacterium]MCI0649306.1 DUF3488 and transglutaminase-like domain-containing protein [Chloroflexota bacterium]MCI0725961.1 DUF3488 and transglutaminase-like domain-containing protein [Chloroflexota bacterium]